MLKNLKWHEIIYSLILIAAGAAMILYSAEMEKLFARGVCIVLIVVGILLILGHILRRQMTIDSYHFMIGVVLIAAGVYFFLNPTMLSSNMYRLLSLIMVMSGVFKLQRAIDLKKMHFGSWVPVAILALLGILVGLVTFLNPDFLSKMVMTLLGGGLIYNGASDFLTTLLTSSRYGKYCVDGAAEDLSDDFFADGSSAGSASAYTTYDASAGQSSTSADGGESGWKETEL